MIKKRVNSHEKEAYDPKIQEHISKIKQRKDEEERKKLREKEQMERKK